MEHRPVRKANRLETFDYSTPAYYFVTVCTLDRKPLLSRVTNADESHRARVILTNLGKETENAIHSISKAYPGVGVEKYVIMPNHFHVILSFSASCENLPNLSRVVQQTKRLVSKKAGFPVWQSHFYDHVIRDEADFQSIWTYIDNNPTKWSLDQYYYEG